MGIYKKINAKVRLTVKILICGISDVGSTPIPWPTTVRKVNTMLEIFQIVILLIVLYFAFKYLSIMFYKIFNHQALIIFQITKYKK